MSQMEPTLRRGSRLLMDEAPLTVSPSLAAAIGINAAIVLQQINYWLVIAEKSKDTRKFKAGKWWTYNTYKQWQEQFPWMSASGVRKTLKFLKDKNLIATVKHGTQGKDHTLWYTINYAAVDALENQNTGEPDTEDSEGKEDENHVSRWDTSTSGSMCPDGTGHLSQSDESYATETTAESSFASFANAQEAGGSPPPQDPPNSLEDKGDFEGWHVEEYLRDELAGSDVPLTRSKGRRYTGEANKLYREGTGSLEIYEAADRVVSEWGRVRLSLDDALRDLRNGRQANGSRPDDDFGNSGVSATPPEVVEYIFANTRTEGIRNNESSIRRAMRKHDFTSSAEPPFPVAKMLGGSENERWKVQDALDALCKRAVRENVA